MAADLKSLFKSLDGDSIRELPDGRFAVWVSYAHDDPIIVPSRDLAEQIATALVEAHSSGASSVRADLW